LGKTIWTDLGGVKDDRRESRRHFTVQSNLDTRLDLVLSFHKGVKEFIGVDHSLPVIGHQSNQGGIPLVDDLGECCRT
jgi:hypothetical protein